MRTENVSFPYPVLGISDDIRPSLEETGCEKPQINISEEGSSFHISVVLKLEDKDILNYIKDGFAEYTVEMSCHSTMYRKCINSTTPEFDFLVEKKLLNGKLEFESFVIAKTDILNYKNEGLNSDYEGHIVNLHKGDLLVAYYKCTIPLNLDLRNIRNMKSFMTVQKTSENHVSYDLESSKIVILLPEEMMAEYNKKPTTNSPEDERRKAIFKGSLFLQALTFALLHYPKYKDREEWAWVNALTYRMNEPDLKEFCKDIFINDQNDEEDQNLNDSFKDIFELAHMMLNQPYMGMLKHVSTDENNVGTIIDE